jgi:hypothetical protein
VGKDGQDDSLKSLYGQLPNGQDLTVGKNVEVGHYDLPDVVDAGDIDQGGLN